MGRLAYAAAVLTAVVALGAAPSARAEPLDFDLARLGSPDPTVWTSLGAAAGTEANAFARESRQRFAVLTSQLALALSSAVLQPASTTGYSGFDVDLEVATVGVDAKALGTAPPTGTGPIPLSNQVWPSRSTTPGQLYLPSIHVRKGLPFSFELGGRMIYLNQSSYYAAQAEAKWALNEGFESIPDVAVRAAYTRLFGQQDLDLGATDLDFMLSKRWGLSGVVSLTPYVAARYTIVSASSGRIQFRPDSPPATAPDDLNRTAAEFPRFTAGYYRTTAGVRFTTYAVSLAAEASYFGGATPKVTDWDGTKVAVKIPSSIAVGTKLGFEF